MLLGETHTLIRADEVPLSAVIRCYQQSFFLPLLWRIFSPDSCLFLNRLRGILLLPNNSGESWKEQRRNSAAHRCYRSEQRPDHFSHNVKERAASCDARGWCCSTRRRC